MAGEATTPTPQATGDAAYRALREDIVALSAEAVRVEDGIAYGDRFSPPERLLAERDARYAATNEFLRNL